MHHIKILLGPRFYLVGFYLAGIYLAAFFTQTSVVFAAEVSFFERATLESLPSEQHTRALAASCAACHGTNGNTVSGNAAGGNSAAAMPVLAGLDATYFTKQMLAFRNGSRSATVMHHHAKGLKADEINDLAVYFSLQNRVPARAPKSQTLKQNHD